MTLTPNRPFVKVLWWALLLLTLTNAAAQNRNEIHPDEQVESDWVNDVPCSKESQGLGFIKGREYRLCFFRTSEVKTH